MRIELAGKASKAGPAEPARPRAAGRGVPSPFYLIAKAEQTHFSASKLSSVCASALRSVPRPFFLAV